MASNSKEFDIDKLLNAINNDSNESIMSYTHETIMTDKNNMLQQLQLSRSTLKQLHKKLKGYRYINDLKDMKYGSYIRWISLKNPEKVYLTNGGIMCDVLFLNKGVHILCKNYRNRFFQINFDTNMIFQQISAQEQIILEVIKHLHS